MLRRSLTDVLTLCRLVNQPIWHSFPQNMAATSVGTKNEITLKGSVEVVTEFFGYAINSVRGRLAPGPFSWPLSLSLQGHQRPHPTSNARLLQPSFCPNFLPNPPLIIFHSLYFFSVLVSLFFFRFCISVAFTPQRALHRWQSMGCPCW